MAVRDAFAGPYKSLVNGLQVVPTAATAIPTVGGGTPTQWVQIEQIVMSGTVAGNLTLTDNAGNALVFPVAVSPGGTVLSFPRPLKLIGPSVKWAATATTTAAIVGFWL